MYAMKPINENFHIISESTSMYKCKSYYNDSDSSSPLEAPGQAAPAVVIQKQALRDNQSNQTALADLTRQQQSQLRRLERLKEKLNQFCDDLNLNHLIQTTNTNNNAKSSSSEVATQPISIMNVKRVNTKTNKSKSCVDDLVIHFDASDLTTVGPLSLFSLFNEMTLKYKTFIQFYLHGTVLKQKQKLVHLNRLIDLFNSLKLTLDNEPRNTYDYGVTFVFKKFSQNERLLGRASLTLPQTNGRRIYGEANIARYLNRLIQNDKNQSKQTSVDSFIVDECIDTCVNELTITQNKDTYVNSLKNQLKTNQYLTGNKLSLADYFVWSQLKQANVKLTSPLNEWSKRLEATDSFVQILNNVTA